MKITLTGATGHIGANMTLALVDKGFQVKAICRKPEKMKVLGDLDIDIVKADVLDKAALVRAFKGTDAVIHLAAKISIEGDRDGSVRKTNVAGTRNVVEACLECGVKKLVHFSSVHAFKYSSHTPLVNENSPPADDRSFSYDQSKALGDKEVFRGIARGLDATILCPTGVIGPHDYFCSRAGELLRKLLAGKMPAIIRGGFNWVDVNDIIAVTLFILENSANSRRYLLAGHWVSFRELAAICQRISGAKAPAVVLPIELAMIGLPFIRIAQAFSKRPPLYTYESLMIIKNDCKNYSSQLAEEELNYTVRPLRESIEAIYRWWLRYSPGDSGT